MVWLPPHLVACLALARCPLYRVLLRDIFAFLSFAVLYEDGDSEEMKFEDLKRYLPKDFRLSWGGAPRATGSSSGPQTSGEPESEPAKKKARHHPWPNEEAHSSQSHAPAGRDQGHFLMHHGAGAEDDGTRGGQGTGLRLDATAAAANVQVKVEEVGEVAEYDGSYDCLICCESVRQDKSKRALRCSECTCNPFHQTCHQSWAQHAKVVPSTCPQCAQPTVVPFTRAR